jgi:ABC-type transporter Mla subunit MlaD
MGSLFKKVGQSLGDFGKKTYKSAGDGISSFGKKADSAWRDIDKALPDAKTFADSVADVSGTIAAGAGSAAAFAAATGIGNAGLSEALAGVSGVAYGINKGATAISGGLDKAQEVSGAARSGIERVRKL